MAAHCGHWFAAWQFVCAVAIGQGHPEFAMLFVAISTLTLTGSPVIEPATAGAAFGSD